MTEPRARYEFLMHTIPPGLAADIAALMEGTDREHRLERMGLAHVLKVDDRQIRETIAELVTVYHIPILSESGRSGYWLAQSTRERDDSAAELLSRANELIARANALRVCVIPHPEPIELHEPPAQQALFELGDILIDM